MNWTFNPNTHRYSVTLLNSVRILVLHLPAPAFMSFSFWVIKGKDDSNVILSDIIHSDCPVADGLEMVWNYVLEYFTQQESFSATVRALMEEMAQQNGMEI
jgi:hypothetical protein